MDKHEGQKDYKVLFCEKTAEVIGGGISPRRVRRIIDLSNEGKHLIHGVKRDKDFESIKREGILNLTPEGGRVSYWTSGLRMFGILNNGFTLSTRDSTFFDYAHSRSLDPHKTFMTIAITNEQELNKIKQFLFKEDGYITIDTAVPADRLALLRVELSWEENLLSLREKAQTAEQIMFTLLEKVLLKGYKAGELISTVL